MPTEFFSGTDWQGSSGPLVNRNVHPDDLYPHSLQGPAGKDALADGLHPILAIGNDAAVEGRDYDQATGVMVTFGAEAERAVINIAHGFICRQYVANVLTYDGGDPATFETSIQIGMRIFVDDSIGLAAGVTVSLSPLNDAGLTNPFAGWVIYDQTEDEDVGIGGANVDAFPKTVANELTYTLLNVMLK